MSYSGFSRHMAHVLRYFFFAPLHAFGLTDGFASPPPLSLAPVFPFPAHAFHMRPHTSVIPQYRNLHLFSIGYAFRPLLRSRLTQGRSALPWNPWIFGLEDSHLHLATHSGILSSHCSTALLSTASLPLGMLLYQPLYMAPQLRCRVSAPDIFGAGPLGQ